MKFVKIYLVIVTVLLVLGLALGVYVWYTLQGINSATNGGVAPERAVSGTAEGTPSTTGTRESITIQTSDLPESQQKILDGLGITGDSFTITPAMIGCAESALGKTRVDEIVSGSAPTPFESLKLLPCVKR